MLVVSFVVLGTPVGKGRPRFARRGNFIATYTPEKTVKFEELVKFSYVYSGQKSFGADIPLSVNIKAYFPFPKSAPKKFVALGEPPFTHKPDCDNIAKSVLDALNGVAFHDESQVSKLVIHKFYSQEPRTEITISEYCEVVASE